MVRENWRQVSGFKALAAIESSVGLSGHSSRENSLDEAGLREELGEGAEGLWLRGQ